MMLVKRNRRRRLCELLLVSVCFGLQIPAVGLEEIVDDDVAAFKSTSEVVERGLYGRGLKLGLDREANRIVEIVSRKSGWPLTKDRGSFFAHRDALATELVMDGQARIVRVFGCDYQSDEKETHGGVQSCLRSVSRMPLEGFSVVGQAVSMREGELELAFACAWSKFGSEAAKSALLGQAHRESPGCRSLEDWLETQDIAAQAGPVQYVDERGVRHFLGISTRALTGARAHDDVAYTLARCHARKYVLLSLQSDVESRSSLVEVGDGDADFSEDRSVTVKDSFVAMREVLCRESRDPLSGMRIVVCVWGTDASLVRDAKSELRASVQDCINLRLDIVRSLGAVRAQKEAGLKNRTLPSGVFASVTNEIRGAETSFAGTSCFGWETGDAGFCENAEAAFYDAYAQALEQIVLQGYAHHSVSCQSHERSLKAEKKARQSRPSFKSRSVETDDGWTRIVEAKGGLPASLEAFRTSRTELRMSGKMEFCGAFRIQEHLQGDGEGRVTVTVRIVPGAQKSRSSKSLPEFLAEGQLAWNVGPRRFLDKDDTLWLLGIGSVDAPDGAVTRPLKMAAQRKALRALCFSLGASVEIETSARSGAFSFEDGECAVGEDLDVKCHVGRLKDSEKLFGDLTKRTFAGIEEHPITGEKVYVTVYAVKVP